MTQDNHIGDQRVRRFVAALRSFEQSGEPSDLVGAFADGATVWRLDGHGERTDVEQFWLEYRSRFEKLSTTFHQAVEAQDRAALEWSSDTVLADGTPRTVGGVTVLELVDGGVGALRAYYDTAAFAPGPVGRTG